MKIQDICQRCRTIYIEIELSDPGPNMTAEELFDEVGYMEKKLCLKCRGWVFRVTNREVLPLEFRLSTRRILFAGLLSAFVWAFFFLCVHYIFVLWPDFKSMSEAQQQEWLFTQLGYAFRQSLCGFVIGFFLLFLAAKFAAIRTDLNTPCLKGSKPQGEIKLFYYLAAIGAGLGVILALFIAPVVASDLVKLQDIILRVLAGGFLGLLMAVETHEILFKFGRRATRPVV